MTLTVTIQQDHYLTLRNYLHWDDKIRSILNGSVKSKSDSTSFTFEDRWSGASIEGVIAGGFVTQITITDAIEPNSWAGRHDWTETGAVVIDVTPGTIAASEVISDFKRFVKKQAGNPLAEFQGDDLIFQSVDSLPPPPTDTWEYYRGGSGDDLFRLNDFGNSIHASGGNDRIEGGDGLDFVDYSALGRAGIKGPIESRMGAGGVWEIVKPGGDVDTLLDVEALFATNARDSLKAGLGGPAYIFGLNGNDRIGGSAQTDFLDGGQGNDTLWGRGGHDVLVGGNGADILRGGNGRDVIFLGDGFVLFDIDPDQVYGNGGRDIFVLDLPNIYNGNFYGQNNGPAVIHDFKDGKDFIGVSGSYHVPGPKPKMSDLDIRQVGSDAMIAYSGHDIARLKNTDATDLTRADFVFGVDRSQYEDQWDYAF